MKNQNKKLKSFLILLHSLDCIILQIKTIFRLYHNTNRRKIRTGSWHHAHSPVPIEDIIAKVVNLLMKKQKMKTKLFIAIWLDLVALSFLLGKMTGLFLFLK